MASSGSKSWTERGLQALAVSERTDFRDPKSDGLVLRVSPSGVKTWALVYRRKGDGKKRRVTIGRFGPGAGQFTLAAARDEASKLRGDIAAKQDPAAKAAALAKADTVSELLDMFLKHHKRPDAAWTKECRRIFETDVKPLIGSIKLPELSRPHVRQVLDRVKARGAKATVNRTLAAIRRALQWSVENDLLASNPAASIKTEIIEAPKDRALSDSEIKSFWAGLENGEAPIGQRARIALKLVLLTGQRPGEVTGALKAEIDLEAGIWRLPESRTKNGKAHVVPLHPLAVELFRSAMQLSPKCPYVFCVNAKGGQGLREAAPMQSHALSHAMRDAAKYLELTEKATPHDLRRTAATHMARLGLPMPHVAAVLNHGISSRRSITERVYVQHDFLPEKTAALTAWGDEIKRIIMQSDISVNQMQVRSTQ